MNSVCLLITFIQPQKKQLGQFNKHYFLLIILTLMYVKIEAIQKLEGIIYR